MKKQINVDRLFAVTTGLAISAVAAFYAVSGLAMIFAAAFWPIILMGVALEVGKIITASYLYRNWKWMPKFIKGYLTAAVAVLMLITSMGVFGYLSRAHIDQMNPSTEAVAKIEYIDTQISRERARIDRSQNAIEQLDAAIDKMIALDRVTQGLQARAKQGEERAALKAEAYFAQGEVDKLLEEKKPLARQIRETQSEVGPIRYVAELLFSDSSQSTLDRAVRWMIVALVLVLDPLALLLIVSANIDFRPQVEAEKKKSRKYEKEAKEWMRRKGNAVDATTKEWNTLDVVIEQEK